MSETLLFTPIKIREITVGGTGQSQVALQRHTVEPATPPGAEPQGP